MASKLRDEQRQHSQQQYGQGGLTDGDRRLHRATPVGQDVIKEKKLPAWRNFSMGGTGVRLPSKCTTTARSKMTLEVVKIRYILLHVFIGIHLAARQKAELVDIGR